MMLSSTMLSMLHLSSVIQRWSWLVIISMIGVLIIASAVADTHSPLLLVESIDFECDEEQVDVDDPLNLIAHSVPGSSTLFPGLDRHVSDVPIELQSSCFADHLLRGPPLC